VSDPKRMISHDEADDALRRFENLFWKLEPGPRISIPARPDYDDDLILQRYIEQQRALSAAITTGDRANG
jgi:hypothetical protein